MRHVKSITRNRPPRHAISLLEKQARAHYIEQTVVQLASLAGIIIDLVRKGDSTQ